MTSRIISCPTRLPGETGRAFVDRMLAELNAKGRASALPTPPKIHIEPVKVVIDAPLQVRQTPKVRSRPKDNPGRRVAIPGPDKPKPGLTPWEIWVLQRLERRPLAEPFGPTYPALPGANKWRRLSRMRALDRDETKAYGQAVLDGINALNAKLLDREVAPFRSNSASGTFHNNGRDILAAINAQNRAKLGR